MFFNYSVIKKIAIVTYRYVSVSHIKEIKAIILYNEIRN